MDDLPQRFVIRESSHRSHNPFTSEKLATLGAGVVSVTRNQRARPCLRVRGDAVHLCARPSADRHWG